MIKKLNNAMKNQYFLLGIIIISVPFLEFFKSNFYSMSSFLFLNILIFFLVLLFFYSIFYLILKIKILSNEKRLKYILFISLFFWALFQFESIQNFFYRISSIDKYTKNFTAELSLIIITIFSLLFLLDNFTKFIKKFIIIFFVAQHFFIYALLAKNFLFKDFNEKSNLITNFKNDNFFSEKEIVAIKKRKNNNIYFLIVEQLTSFDEYTNLGGKQDYKIWENDFNNFGYSYIDQSYAVFTNTSNMLGSILNLKPILTNQLNYKKKLRFPEILSSFKLDAESELNKNLKMINYNFFWIGNTLYECVKYNEKICLNYNQKIPFINYIINKINFNILSTFLYRTPIEQIYRSLYEYFSIKRISSLKEIKLGTIERFILEKKDKDNNNSNFYFIHDLGASKGVIFDHNCKAIDYLPKKEGEKNKVYKSVYLKSYECMMKRIKKFITFIDIEDPNAVVVILADHNERTLYEAPFDLRRYKIFNLIKVNDNCKKNIFKKINNINSVRLALSCATSTPAKFLENKSYFGIPNNRNLLFEISTN